MDTQVLFTYHPTPNTLYMCPYRAECVWDMTLRPELWTLGLWILCQAWGLTSAPLASGSSFPYLGQAHIPMQIPPWPSYKLGLRTHHCLEPLERRNFFLDWELKTKIACAHSHVCCCPVYGKPEAYGMWRLHSEVFKNVWAMWHQGNGWWNHSSVRPPTCPTLAAQAWLFQSFLLFVCLPQVYWEYQMTVWLLPINYKVLGLSEQLSLWLQELTISRVRSRFWGG